MIIDSHAHYTNPCYQKPFRYLTWHREGGYGVEEGELPQLLQAMAEAGIACSVEAGVNLQSCRTLLDFCREHPGRVFPAIGLHPTRAIFEKWSDRHQLAALAAQPNVVAVGETGLDYHWQRREQHRRKQYLWFLYQLDLSRTLGLPVILHVRDAHRDVLRILRHHPQRKLGGVVHCFSGTPQEALEYVALGYHLGIGGALLQPGDRGDALREVVARVPLERLLVETDAPYILPYCKDVIAPKVLRRTRNTSLILPAVIAEIARLRGIPAEMVERATAENAIRLFRLPLEEENTAPGSAPAEQ